MPVRKEATDCRYRAYDNVTDKIWDTINKGVCISNFWHCFVMKDD